MASSTTLCCSPAHVSTSQCWKMTFLIFPRYSRYSMWVRWENLQPSYVKFVQNSVCQKWLKLVHFWRSYSKNKNVSVFLGHSIVPYVYSYWARLSWDQHIRLTNRELVMSRLSQGWDHNSAQGKCFNDCVNWLVALKLFHNLRPRLVKLWSPSSLRDLLTTHLTASRMQ